MNEPWEAMSDEERRRVNEAFGWLARSNIPQDKYDTIFWYVGKLQDANMAARFHNRALTPTANLEGSKGEGE